MKGIARWLGSVLLVVASGMGTTPALAAEADDELLPVKFRFEQYNISFHINDDLTHVEEREFRTRVLDASQIENAKDTTISYSASVQKVEIIEACTLKADGRRIPVPADNYQENANTGHRGNGPVFSDYATLGLVFPDVAVGDAVYIHYRIVQTEPIFPGEFDEAAVFYKSRAYDDLRVVIDAPASLQAKYEVRGMTKAVEERDGRRILTMTWNNPKPVREKRRDWSVFDDSVYPGFAYSTFDNYEEIARAYGVRALPKAVPNDAVRKLAADIVKGKKGKREKAKALYEWVARNITYAGNCVGVGAVVPHDIDFILGNRMGDCKDHATLLQALLATQGIKSDQALVNASSGWELKAIPLVSSVNHVINYIPEFDLFLDSTSSETPFGYLPDQVAGKPVLLVGNFREGMRTPPSSYAADWQRLTSETEFLADGTARGHVKVEQGGAFAIESRAGARDITPEEVDQRMRRMFDAEGKKGFGKLVADDAAPLVDTYRYEVQFERPLALDLPGAGGLSIDAPYYSNGGVSRFVIDDDHDEGEHRSSCSGGRSEETHVIRLPVGTTVFAMPDDVHITSANARYDATYRRDGTTITAHRVLEDRTPGPVCTAEQRREYAVFSRRLMRDLRAQIVYQLKEGAESP